MEQEVSDRIEQAVQQLGQLREVESRSERGLSTVTVRIKDQYDRSALPQVWDELRRKVNDVQGQLPPGAGPSVVNDDYGDVWGVYLAVYGDEYSYAELRDIAKMLRRELLLVQDVAKVALWGDQQEVVYVEPNRDRMSQLGIQPQLVIQTLVDKNLVADAGRVQVGPEFITIDPTGAFESVDDIANMLIRGGGPGGNIFLRDIATVRRGYIDPPRTVLRYDGQTAVGLGISTVSGGNVVRMGEGVDRRVARTAPADPTGRRAGCDFAAIEGGDGGGRRLPGQLVGRGRDRGRRAGHLHGSARAAIIGFILLLTILATFIFMGPWNVALERISLGALVIALGMLVDNAIVVVDGMLVRTQRGQDAAAAAAEVVGQSSIPLLGATAVAILAFGAIGLSNDSTGEFCRSLFQVVFLSLGLSWVTGVTVTPLLCVMFLPVSPAGDSTTSGDAYAGGFYRLYRRFLLTAIRFRWGTVAVVLGAFALSLWGFQFVQRSFFPDSTRPQFMVNIWLPQGTRIDETLRTVEQAEGYLRDLEGVSHVTSFVGAGGLRFLLTYAPEKPNSAYAQFLVDVDDYRRIGALLPQVEQTLAERFPNIEVFTRRFALGPGSGGKIQVRWLGPDANVLRDLADRTTEILKQDGDATAVNTDWRQRVKLLRPIVAEDEANNAGITQQDVALAARTSFEGARIGVYREEDELLPIIFRPPDEERGDVASIENLQIWSPAAQQAIPLRKWCPGSKPPSKTS